jgi:formylglycine-generating enzyme required for sulfatase activity
MSEYQPHYEKSYGLVVGIDDFKAAPPLATARFGAEAMADVLENRYRFDQVIALYDKDATKANIEDAYSDLRYLMKPDDRFVVYVAGHGVGVEGMVRAEGWLVAHDSDPQRHRRMIRMRDLVDPNYTKAKHSLVILDTCHSGFTVTYEAPRMVITPLSDPRLAVGQFLIRRACQVFASANPLETATDAGLLEGHTPFTGYLLRALSGEESAARSRITNLLTAASVAEYVRDSVVAFAGNWQGPQMGILPGDGGGVLVWEVPAALDVLPDRLRRGLTSQDAETRFLALDRVEKLLPDPRYAGTLREVLHEMALNDPDQEVKSRAMDLLLETERVRTLGPVIEVVEPASKPKPVPTPPPPAPRKEFEPKMVAVPAGGFLMGSDRSVDQQARDNEPDQFPLYLPDYAIGKCPVTVGQYRYFVEAGGYRERKYWTDAGWQWRESQKRTEPDYWKDNKWTGDNRLPVVGVTWYEAYAYCRWLAKATGRGYRLPTEAEWEKAARGTDGRIYPWGDEYIVGYANINESGLDGGRYLERTSPVGAYPKGISPYGAYDMSGNVWEWCLSKYSERYLHPEDSDPEGNVSRVLRGGSWDVNQIPARAAVRFGLDPSYWSVDRGFRVGGVVPVLP